MQHLVALLASSHEVIVEEALKTLFSYVKKTHLASVRWAPGRDISAKLFVLCRSWSEPETVSVGM
jgi:hypothetical protein